MASKGDVLPEEISDSDDYNDSSEEDIEDTLQQEEEEAKALGEEDNEQDDLEAEANMPIEELMAKYYGDGLQPFADDDDEEDDSDDDDDEEEEGEGSESVNGDEEGSSSESEKAAPPQPPPVATTRSRRASTSSATSASAAAAAASSAAAPPQPRSRRGSMAVEEPAKSVAATTAAVAAESKGAAEEGEGSIATNRPRRRSRLQSELDVSMGNSGSSSSSGVAAASATPASSSSSSSAPAEAAPISGRRGSLRSTLAAINISPAESPVAPQPASSSTSAPPPPPQPAAEGGPASRRRSLSQANIAAPSASLPEPSVGKSVSPKDRSLAAKALSPKDAAAALAKGVSPRDRSLSVAGFKPSSDVPPSSSAAAKAEPSSRAGKGTKGGRASTASAVTSAAAATDNSMKPDPAANGITATFTSAAVVPGTVAAAVQSLQQTLAVPKARGRPAKPKTQADASVAALAPATTTPAAAISSAVPAAPKPAGAKAAPKLNFSGFTLAQLHQRRSELFGKLRQLKKDEDTDLPQLYYDWTGKRGFYYGNALPPLRSTEGLSAAEIAAAEDAALADELLADDGSGTAVAAIDIDQLIEGRDSLAAAIAEPKRPKDHWGFLLDEMTWLAEDVATERKWKQSMAKKLGAGVMTWHARKERKIVEDAIADELRRRKRAAKIAGHVAKFWGKIDKLVIYKHKSRLDALRRQAMDKHLNFLVGQSERYSAMLAKNIAGLYSEGEEGGAAPPDSTTATTSVAAGPSSASSSAAAAAPVLENGPSSLVLEAAPVAAAPTASRKRRRASFEAESSSSSAAAPADGASSSSQAPPASRSRRSSVSSAELDARASALSSSSTAVDDSAVVGGTGPTRGPSDDVSIITGSDGGPDAIERLAEELVGDDASDDSDLSANDEEFTEDVSEQDDEETLEAEEAQAARERAAKRARRRLAALEGGVSESKEGEGDGTDAADGGNHSEEEEEEDELAALQREQDLDIEELRRRYGYGDDGQPPPLSDHEDENEEDGISGDDEAAAESAGAGASSASSSIAAGRSRRGSAASSSAAKSKDAMIVEDGVESSSSSSAPAAPTAAAGTAATSSAVDSVAVASAAEAAKKPDFAIPLPFLLRNGHFLRPYQRHGLDWLVSMHDRRLNGILADEMGLGKTIQTIALLAHLASARCVWGPHLIVVPTSTLLNWETEFKRWCPALKVLTYYGSIKDRKAKRVGWTKPNAFHVCVTSYQTVLSDASMFRRKKWYYMILDEAHYIKNYQSARWQTLLTFSSRRRLLLTGTPLQNSLMELWSLMHFLMPHLFRSQAEFKQWFSNPLTAHVEGGPVVDKSLVARLHAVLRPFVMRRLKSEVATQMPKKYEHVVLCRLSSRQRFLYEEFMSRSSTRAALSGSNMMSMMNVLMQLRKVCNHPDLFEPRPIVSPLELPRLALTIPSLLVDPRVAGTDLGFSQPAVRALRGTLVGSRLAEVLGPTSNATIAQIVAKVIEAGGDDGLLFDLLDAALSASTFDASTSSPGLLKRSSPYSSRSILSPKVLIEDISSVASAAVTSSGEGNLNLSANASASALTSSPYRCRSITVRPAPVTPFVPAMLRTVVAVRSNALVQANPQIIELGTVQSGILPSTSSAVTALGGLSAPSSSSASSDEEGEGSETAHTSELMNVAAAGDSSSGGDDAAFAALPSTLRSALTSLYSSVPPSAVNLSLSPSSSSADASAGSSDLDNFFSSSFAAGISSLRGIAGGLTLADLELRHDGLSQWQAAEVAALRCPDSDFLSPETVFAACAARERSEGLPHDVHIASLSIISDAIVHDAVSGDVSGGSSGSGGDDDVSMNSQPTSDALLDHNLSDSSNEAVSMAQLLTGPISRFATNLPLLHAALRARQRVEIEQRLRTVARANAERCANDVTSMRRPLYGADCVRACSISLISGWSKARRGVWDVSAPDVIADAWRASEEEEQALQGDPAASAAYSSLLYGGAPASAAGVGTSSAAGAGAGAGFLPGAPLPRKTPDELFGVRLPTPPEERTRAFLTGAPLRGGLARPNSLARPSEVVAVSSLGAAPGALSLTKLWSQAYAREQERAIVTSAVRHGHGSGGAESDGLEQSLHQHSSKRRRTDGATALSVSAGSRIPGSSSPISVLSVAASECVTPSAWASYSSVLRGMVSSFPERYASLLPELQRFAFVIPKARALPPALTSPGVPLPPRPSADADAAATSLALQARSDLHDVTIRSALSFPDRRLVQFDCGKLQALDTLLRERKAGGHRCLIFTQMTRMLDVLEEFLNLQSHTYLRLDGATKVEDRQRLMDRFNRDPRVFCFILSTRSGGLGINLQGADTVIFYDSDWNPAMDAQAQDRAHRIGQTRDVHIYRLISESTVEENILLKARQKQQLASMSLEEGNFNMAFFTSFGLRDIVGGGGEGAGADASSGAGAGAATQPAMSAAEMAAALAAVEDEADVAASRRATAEVRAEMEEFSEDAPVTSGSAGSGTADGAAAEASGDSAAGASAAAANEDGDEDEGAGAGASSKKGKKKASTAAKAGKGKTKKRMAASSSEEEGGVEGDDSGSDAGDGQEDDDDGGGWDSEVGDGQEGEVEASSDGESSGSYDGENEQEGQSSDDEEEGDEDADAPAGKASKTKGKKGGKGHVRFAAGTKAAGEGGQDDADEEDDEDGREVADGAEAGSSGKTQGAKGSSAAAGGKKKGPATGGKGKKTAKGKGASSASAAAATKSRLDIDLDELSRRTVAAEEGEDLPDASAVAGAGAGSSSSSASASGGPVGPSARALFDAVTVSTGDQSAAAAAAVQLRTRDRVAIAMAKFAEIERTLQSSERYAVRYRESRDPHPWVEPSLLASIEAGFAIEEKEWELEQLEAIKEEEEAKAEADADLLQLTSLASAGGSSSSASSTGVQAGADLYTRTLRDLRHGIRVREVTGSAWESRFDEAAKEHYYYNIDTKVAQWEKPLVLRMADSRRRAAAERWAGITHLPAVALAIMRFLEPSPDRLRAACVCKKWRAAAEHPALMKYVRVSSGAHNGGKGGTGTTDAAKAFIHATAQAPGKTPAELEAAAAAAAAAKAKSRFFDDLPSAVASSVAGDTIVIEVGSHYVPGPVVVTQPIRIISGGVKGAGYAYSDTPDNEWICGPAGEWYPSLAHMPPSRAKAVGLSSGYKSDAGFAPQGAHLSTDLSVADSAVIRMEGPLVWAVKTPPKLSPASSSSESSGAVTGSGTGRRGSSDGGGGLAMSPGFYSSSGGPLSLNSPGGPFSPSYSPSSSSTAWYLSQFLESSADGSLSSAGELAARTLGYTPGTSPIAVAASVGGGGQIRGLTLRNVSSSVPFCLVVTGPGPLLTVCKTGGSGGTAADAAAASTGSIGPAASSASDSAKPEPEASSAHATAFVPEPVTLPPPAVPAVAAAAAPAVPPTFPPGPPLRGLIDTPDGQGGVKRVYFPDPGKGAPQYEAVRNSNAWQPLPPHAAEALQQQHQANWQASKLAEWKQAQQAAKQAADAAAAASNAAASSTASSKTRVSTIAKRVRHGSTAGGSKSGGQTLQLAAPVQVLQCDLGNRGGPGAAVYLTDGAHAIIAACRISSGSGSGILVSGGSSLTLTYAQVQDCGAAGLTVTSGTAAMSYSRITGCAGSAVRVRPSPLMLPSIVYVPVPASASSKDGKGVSMAAVQLVRDEDDGKLYAVPAATSDVTDADQSDVTAASDDTVYIPAQDPEASITEYLLAESGIPAPGASASFVTAPAASPAASSSTAISSSSSPKKAASPKKQVPAAPTGAATVSSPKAGASTSAHGVTSLKPLPPSVFSLHNDLRGNGGGSWDVPSTPVDAGSDTDAAAPATGAAAPAADACATAGSSASASTAAAAATSQAKTMWNTSIYLRNNAMDGGTVDVVGDASSEDDEEGSSGVGAARRKRRFADVVTVIDDTSAATASSSASAAVAFKASGAGSFAPSRLRSTEFHRQLFNVPAPTAASAASSSSASEVSTTIPVRRRVYVHTSADSQPIYLVALAAAATAAVDDSAAAPEPATTESASSAQQQLALFDPRRRLPLPEDLHFEPVSGAVSGEGEVLPPPGPVASDAVIRRLTSSMPASIPRVFLVVHSESLGGLRAALAHRSPLAYTKAVESATHASTIAKAARTSSGTTPHSIAKALAKAEEKRRAAAAGGMGGGDGEYNPYAKHYFVTGSDRRASATSSSSAAPAGTAPTVANAAQPVMSTTVAAAAVVPQALSAGTLALAAAAPSYPLMPMMPMRPAASAAHGALAPTTINYSFAPVAAPVQAAAPVAQSAAAALSATGTGAGRGKTVTSGATRGRGRPPSAATLAARQQALLQQQQGASAPSTAAPRPPTATAAVVLPPQVGPRPSSAAAGAAQAPPVLPSAPRGMPAMPFPPTAATALGAGAAGRPPMMIMLPQQQPPGAAGTVPALVRPALMPPAAAAAPGQAAAAYGQMMMMQQQQMMMMHTLATMGAAQSFQQQPQLQQMTSGAQLPPGMNPQYAAALAAMAAGGGGAAARPVAGVSPLQQQWPAGGPPRPMVPPNMIPVAAAAAPRPPSTTQSPARSNMTSAAASRQSTPRKK